MNSAPRERKPPIPLRLVEFTRGHIDSRFMFLLALNLFLLAVGCLMEIFPAIVVPSGTLGKFETQNT